jgi:hypothetical protein
LAERLQVQGWEPVFALKSYNLQGIDFPWQGFAAPCPPFLGRGNSYTFADILETFGFGQIDSLRSHLQNWQDLLKTIQPDLVITDHAPGLVLAARGLVPTVVIGSHFAVPPALEVFPAFRSAVPPESTERQQRVSETVRRLVPLETSLGEGLNGDRSFIFSIPELDIYKSYRSATTQYVSVHLTPLLKSPALAQPSYWSYLNKDYPAYDLVCSTFKTESQFQPLQTALIGKSIAIHHGGLTTTVACLLAGIPQLILPRHIEQQLNGAALLRLGAARMLITPTEEKLFQAQGKLLTLINQAQGLANYLASWNQNFLDRIIESCYQLTQ